MSTPDLEAAVARLEAAGVPAPRDEVRRLWALAGDFKRFETLIARRAAREPYSHLAGYRDFWNHRFKVTADVLDPRPETELLVELALAHSFERVLDLGTGSGAIVVSLLAERATAHGVGTDLSKKALKVAADNAAMAGVGERLKLTQADWFNGVQGPFDLIVSNPPYIALEEMQSLQPEVRDFEPREALTDEGDGLGCYREIAAGASPFLSPNGRILVEIGPTQADAVKELFRASGLQGIEVHQDLNGHDRVVLAHALKG